MRLAAVALALALAGCGVRPESAPARLDPDLVPSESAPARPVVATVYFLRDDRLVPVRRLVVAPATAAQRLAELVRGPADDAALGSMLDRGDPPHVTVEAGVATVALPASFVALPRPDQRLGAAQLVLTLTDSADVAVVRFTSAGRAFAVPRGDGSLNRAPLTRADYAALAGP